MQISKVSDNKFQVKAKDGTVLATDDGIEIEGLKFTGPGEYERKGIFVEGILPDGEGSIFVVHTEEISMCFLGKISKLLSNEAIKSLGDIDILFVPIGADGSMKPQDAEKTVSTIDPRIVVPTHVDPAVNLETALGTKVEEIDVFKIKKAELPVEDRKLILIS